MTEQTILAPIELTDDELLAVSGGIHIAVGISQRNYQSAELAQVGGYLSIGGGNGALLRELMVLRPDLHGIVFDLPETVRDEAAFDDRIGFVAGNFFESVPAGDAYVLCGILHDWSDERAGMILRTIRAAARPGAHLLLLESVVADGNEPQGAKWLDLLMLVLGGRERTEEEWRGLLDGAGFVAHDVEDGLIQATCR